MELESHASYRDGGDMRMNVSSLNRNINALKTSEGINYFDDNDGSGNDDDGRPKRTGTVWTASAHIVTAVIGSGVLSLAWSISKLGWIVGPSTLIIFAIITYFSSSLLADCYRTSDPNTLVTNGRKNGKRNYTYMDAVRSNLGEVQTKFCALAQYTSFVCIMVGYTITASISMVAITRSNCFHTHGHESPCYASTYPYVIMFGLMQVILSQIPSFSKIWWLSIVAAIMSVSYSSIAIGLGIHTIQGGGNGSHGTLGGLFYDGQTFLLDNKSNVWIVLQALGNIAFAYAYSLILIEIQDTIRSPPDETNTMKKANFIGVSTTTIFYLLCGCSGYASFGENAPGNLLTGFGFYEPYWLVDIANAFVVIHLLGAFQVFSQPVFAFFEECISFRYPKNTSINKVYKINIPFFGSSHNINIFKLIWRTTFVLFTTLIAMIFPFFNDILGIIGAVTFWPLTIYFPIQMYIHQSKTQKWTTKWCLLQVTVLFFLILSLAVLVASMTSVVTDLQVYKPFHAHS